MIRKGTLKQSKSKYSKLFIREEYFKFIKGRYFCMKNLLEHFNINVANNGIYYRNSLMSWINIIKKSPTNFYMTTEVY